jgi:hypothetical protein
MTPSPPAPGPLAFEALEAVYETLASGIDRAGASHEAVFLAKLALVLAHRAGAGVDFADCVETALRDLDVVAHPLGKA